MEADDLVLVGGPLRRPAGDALVQLGAQLLGQALVGGLADQAVREAERVLAAELRAVRADELLLHQRQQVRLRRVGEQLGEGAGWKLRPSTDAWRSTVRSPGARRSMRAASTVWSVGGSVASSCSAWAATSCSRNSGLPSAVSTIRPASRDSSPAAPTRPPRVRVREPLEHEL